MRPRVFPEQIQQLPPPINQVISFENYKIDYSQFLGEGDFGKFYALIPRPENEKNLFSSWMPYIYDKIYPAKSNGKNEYCIKISHFSIDSMASGGLWEKHLQNESAILRNQYGVYFILQKSLRKKKTKPKNRKATQKKLFSTILKFIASITCIQFFSKSCVTIKTIIPRAGIFCGF